LWRARRGNSCFLLQPPLIPMGADEPAEKVSRDMETEIKEWLARGSDDDETLAALDALVARYGADAVSAWKDQSHKHRHRLLHHIAFKGWVAALERAVCEHKFDINVQRDSDQCTAAHLAIWFKQEAVLNKLWDLKADTTLPNKYGESADQKWQQEREKYEYMIFLDLELTSGFYERAKAGPPKILEAAIVITDKDLAEKGRGQWVVGGYSKEQLNSFAEFHQQNFRDAKPGGEFPPLEGSEGGNGLFSDVLNSKLSVGEVEDAMLALVKKHCPEGYCPIVGYSVQCDREVLMLEMPRFYSYLSHQIVDLSSMLRMGRLWLPKKLEARQKRETKYNHRALNDVEDSIETLAWIRDNLFQKPEESSA